MDFTGGMHLKPSIWFDTQAGEAAAFYTRLFPDSRIEDILSLPDIPSGEVELVSFSLSGISFEAMSAGPYAALNPAISFIIACDSAEEFDHYWNHLSQEGKTLTVPGKYGFSERYGWIQDQFGVSWQPMLTRAEGDPRPKIVPALLFSGNHSGKAASARQQYHQVMPDSELGTYIPYPKQQLSDGPEKTMFSDMRILNQHVALMDNPLESGFPFNEAISLALYCDTQEQVDFLFSALSLDPKAEQCGWLKDSFGVSWQIVPKQFNWMIKHGSKRQIKQVIEAVLKMKKPDISVLESAYR